MRKTFANRALAIAVACFVALTFTVMTSAQANAASKKTVYVVTKAVSTYYDMNGKLTDKWTRSYTYDKNGLRKSSSVQNSDINTKSVYKRNAKGAVTSIRSQRDGKPFGLTENKYNKKGQLIKSQDFTYSKGKKVLDYTTTYKYYSNGHPSQVVSKSGVFQTITKFRKNGTPSSGSTKSDFGNYVYTYDTKGRTSKETFKTSYGSGTVTYSYKTDKKGNLIQQVQTTKRTDSSGTSTTVTTDKFTNTYDSHGNLVKQVTKSTMVSGDTTNTNTSIYTYKYKAVKIDKKYLKYVDTESEA